MWRMLTVHDSAGVSVELKSSGGNITSRGSQVSVMTAVYGDLYRTTTSSPVLPNEKKEKMKILLYILLALESGMSSISLQESQRPAQPLLITATAPKDTQKALFL